MPSFTTACLCAVRCWRTVLLTALVCAATAAAALAEERSVLRWTSEEAVGDQPQWPAGSVTADLAPGSGAALLWASEAPNVDQPCPHRMAASTCPLCPRLRYGYQDPDYPQRHTGMGDPLLGASWLNRPLHADGFVGGVFGDNNVNLRGAVLAGVRLGWNLDHYWGLDLRWGYARPQLKNAVGLGYYQALDTQVLYYPWGDSRWRPFVLVGAGIARYTFVDEIRGPITQVMAQLPVGVGLKYALHRGLAIRMELLDNIALGAPGNKVVNNYSISGGIEWHFGGRRRSYFPFDPGLSLR